MHIRYFLCNSFQCIFLFYSVYFNFPPFLVKSNRKNSFQKLRLLPNALSPMHLSIWEIQLFHTLAIDVNCHLLLVILSVSFTRRIDLCFFANDTTHVLKTNVFSHLNAHFDGPYSMTS